MLQKIEDVIIAQIESCVFIKLFAFICANRIVCFYKIVHVYLRK